MRDFSEICSKMHCKTCRDLDGGREWRLDISRYYSVGSVDFECVHGIPWGGESPVKTEKDTVPMAIPTIEALEAEIAGLGSPPWLSLKLLETKTFIEASDCRSCAIKARLNALRGWIDDWRRLETV